MFVALMCSYLCGSLLSVVVTIWEHIELNPNKKLHSIATDTISILTVLCGCARPPVYLYFDDRLRRDFISLAKRMFCYRQSSRSTKKFQQQQHQRIPTICAIITTFPGVGIWELVFYFLWIFNMFLARPLSPSVTQNGISRRSTFHQIVRDQMNQCSDFDRLALRIAIGAESSGKTSTTEVVQVLNNSTQIQRRCEAQILIHGEESSNYWCMSDDESSDYSIGGI
jgi:hypothetical protein